MLFYPSRWYDPYLNRFTQPDSIIPDPSDPQSWDRYAYARNNPIRYVDPLGHRACENKDDSTECDWKTAFVLDRAEKILEQDGGKNDLRAMVRIIRAGASVFHSYDQLMPTLGLIFNGTETGAPFALGFAVAAGRRCDALGQEGCGESNFLDTGFHEDFQDGHNQIFHYWGYVANTYSGTFIKALLGTAVAGGANFFHEIVESSLGHDGTSWQDFSLAGAGVWTGLSISMGVVPTSDLADFVNALLAPTGPGALGIPGFITQIFPLAGSPPLE